MPAPDDTKFDPAVSAPSTAQRITETGDTIMTTSQRIWISQQAKQRLQAELAELQSLDGRDTDGSSDDENELVIRRARRGRIQQIHELLINAVVGEDPPNDGVAEPGMVVTIRYDDTGEIDDPGDTETFLLGVRGAEYGDLEVYSVESPLGAALLGARPGERRSYVTPAGGSFSVTVLEAVPYGLHRVGAVNA